MTQEVYFFGGISVITNLATYYFLIMTYLRISRYKHLRKERTVKVRWITQRKNIGEYRRRHATLKPSNLDTTDEHKDAIAYKPSYFVLLTSNTFLMLGNILTMVALLHSFMDYDSSVERFKNIFLGLAGFFSWMNILTIMSISKSLGGVAESLRRTVREVSLLLYGITPVFLAFLFSGFCAFHSHERFDTLKKVGASLGAILCGDEVTGFLYAAMDFGSLGLLYSMGFCVLFMVCIHNVLIFVVSDAFRTYIIEASKKKNGSPSRPNSRRPSGKNGKLTMVNVDSETRFRYEKSAISKDLYQEKRLLDDQKEVDKTKDKLFYSIVPQYRESHILELNMRKDFIVEDLHHLKETFQDVIEEPLGSLR